jgi:NAD(P)H-dependent flavin oxidoreductase YrpB (nitropropane dioxygenase family)
LKQQVFQLSREGSLRVFTDPLCSPTGFPFKVVQLPRSLSDTRSIPPRERCCDLGYLRHAYRKADGTAGYRCPAEPVEDFIRKGGTLEETNGRECVCNGLMATIGLAQVNSEKILNRPLVTAGNEVAYVARFLRPGSDSYTAAEVIGLLLDKVEKFVAPPVTN